LFMPQEQVYREEYEAGWSVINMFTLTGQGFTSHRDDFAIAFSGQEAIQRLNKLATKNVSDDEIRAQYNLLDTGTWHLESAREQIREDKNIVRECLYRPFDLRFCMLSPAIMDRPRMQSQSHMLEPNIAISTTRSIEIAEGFQHIFCTSHVMDRHAVSIKEINYLFPLWRYPSETEAALGMEREANLNSNFVAEVKERVGEVPTPEDIFHYTYAVFHAPTYRTRYAAFLKTDFPRLPLPPNSETFHSLAALGAKLTALHLLEDPGLEPSGIAFPVAGDHTVKKMKTAMRYIPPTADGGKPGRVRLNDMEYFDNVPPEAWEFRVGGYQPAAKWLEDRAGRTLTADDIAHYRRMIAAMRETAALLPVVDAAFADLLIRNTAAESPPAE
jgi:predicted helicase